jgi:hypothetical protein
MIKKNKAARQAQLTNKVNTVVLTKTAILHLHQEKGEGICRCKVISKNAK